MITKIQKIIQILNKKYKIKHWREEPFRVLISAILSQRTKDEVTREASKKLFKVAFTPEKILRLTEKQIAELIYPVGFYRQKTKKIKRICKILLEKYEGKVPNDRNELIKLPGVGGKSADIVLLFGYGKNIIPVDTHVVVISKRWNLTKNKYPEKIREDLHKIIPEKSRKIFNNLLVEFGKEYCTARNPKCYICPVEKFCPYENKKKY